MGIFIGIVLIIVVFIMIIGIFVSDFGLNMGKMKSDNKKNPNTTVQTNSLTSNRVFISHRALYIQSLISDFGSAVDDTDVNIMSTRITADCSEDDFNKTLDTIIKRHFERRIPTIKEYKIKISERIFIPCDFNRTNYIAYVNERLNAIDERKLQQILTYYQTPRPITFPGAINYQHAAMHYAANYYLDTLDGNKDKLYRLAKERKYTDICKMLDQMHR